MASAGFDRDVYPGDALMQTLISTTNFKFCGYYLHPAPSHSDGSWMGKRTFLTGLGWGLAPIYVGQQTTGPGSHNPSAAQGTTDGSDAAALMASEGFPAGSYVYLDLENGPPLPQVLSNYTGAWCDAVTAGGYSPGVYVSHHMAGDIQTLRPAARIWAIFVTTTNSHPIPGPPYPDGDPSGSGFAGAYLWQCHQNGEITIPGVAAPLQIDADTALSDDPST
jgi:hypothetical protein